MPILQHLLIFGLFAFMLGLPAWLFWRQDREYKQRKQKYELARNIANMAFRQRIEQLQLMAAEVEKQKTDRPVITVPMNWCERQERRRILKLEGNSDAAR